MRAALAAALGAHWREIWREIWRVIWAGSLVGVVSGLGHATSAAGPVISWREGSDGVVFQLREGTLRVQVWTGQTLRVSYTPAGAVEATPSLSVVSAPQRVRWRTRVTPLYVSILTGSVEARVDRSSSAVSFFDGQGKAILSEMEGGRRLTPVTVPGPKPESGFRAEQSFKLLPGEEIYGLGQHRLPTNQGSMGYRGTTVTLEQTNREVAIPFLTSSRGYGVFWDNAAHTEVAVGAGDTRVVPSAQLFDEEGHAGGLTGRYFEGHDFAKLVTTRTDPVVDFNWPDAPAAGLSHNYFSVRWTGSVKVDEPGDYTFVTTSDDGVRLWVDDKEVIDDWSNHAARDDSATVHFTTAGLHKIRMEFFQDTRDAIARLAWRHASVASTVWSSEVAKGIDYYFIEGPELDRVIGEYRGLTGQAPMPPKWALGYWQSKERYGSQEEWLDIAKRYRDSGEPIDSLVQDFLYWEPYPWGSNAFDPKRYPDPAGAIARLHDEYHLHLMISVWGKFYPGSADNPDRNYDEMSRAGFLYPAEPDSARYYDAFNPGARGMYWSFLRDQLYSKGIDAWWLDASEPEVDMQSFRKVEAARGLGALVLNAWPLMHTTGVYEGQRQASPNKRVFILTRSAFAGQQRNGAATWSGDITGDWDTFGRQIPAGLHFCLSGIPYWTTDIGGFFVNYPGGSENPEYGELFTRWFEWGAFCPIFRVHGTNTPKELWRFGPKFEPILVRYDQLRYRLMPYIYSLAGQVTANSGTMMRALVMDFPADVEARESRDEFMFGPSLLICPVVHQGAISRSVYLPSGTSWTDFWTGKSYVGGRSIEAAAPLETMPIFVRAGSIVPMGPYLQYSSEKAEDPIEVRVYRGANGSFSLYEDDGESYDYAKGAFATIPFSWDEKARLLRIGARRGGFPGMLGKRTFRIVSVGRENGSGLKGTGLEISSSVDRTVTYTGAAVSIRL